MSAANARNVLIRLRRALGDERAADVPDGQLLERFVGANDQEAFAALVRRHGGLVLGVCRRVLHQTQDAEDVFQAAFLVLARKAASIRSRESVGSWLYRVALRLAHKARAGIAQRRQRESEAPPRQAADPLADLSWREAQTLIDDELARLPEVCRAPLLLCYLQGLTQDEAARRLGWCKRTLKARLHRGRDLLRARLARRGLPLGAALFATLLPQAGAAQPGPRLVDIAIRAAVPTGAAEAVVSASVRALVEGAVRGPWTARGKFLAAAALLVGLLGAGLGLLPGAPQTASQQPPPQPKAAATPVDRFDDLLPAGSIMRLGTVRLRHGGTVGALAWTPDGKTVVSGGGFSDYTVRMWDAATGKQIRQFKADSWAVRALALSPDGKQIAAGNKGGSCTIWDATSGRSLLTFGFGGQAVGDFLVGVTFAADGKDVLWAGAAGGVIRSNSATGGSRHEFVLGQRVLAVAWSPDRKRLASAGEDKFVRLWDGATGRLLRTLPHQAAVAAVAFAPDGKLLATGGKGKTVRLWDPVLGKDVGRLEGHLAAIKALAFTPDGKTLASTSDDWTVRLWDVATRKEILCFRKHQAPVMSVAFSPDGKRVASGGNDKENTVRIWDAATGQELVAPGGHNGWVGGAVLLPDRKTLLTGGSDGTLRLWDLPSGREQRHFTGRQSRGKAFAVSSDRKWVAAGGSNKLVLLLEIATGKVVREFRGHKAVVNSVAFSPDGKTLVSGGKDEKIIVWDVDSGQELQRFGVPGDMIFTFAFTPDGKYLFTGGSGRTVRRWEMATGKAVALLPPHKAVIEQVALSPDSQRLASVSNDQSVALWDLAGWRELRRIRSIGGVGYCVAFAADGRTLATGTGGRDVRLWEVATGTERLRLDGHRGAVAAVEFLPDRHALLSGSSDGTALIWDLPTAVGRAPRTGDLKADEFEAEWQLYHRGGTRGYRALWVLASAPKQTVARLRAELRPVLAVDAKQLERWIADLGNDRFAVREKATTTLRQAGESAWPALRRALAGAVPLETRRRIESLLEPVDALGLTPQRVRALRGLELLETIRTAEATQLVRALAAGAQGAWLTEEARATLRRLPGQR